MRIHIATTLTLCLLLVTTLSHGAPAAAQGGKVKLPRGEAQQATPSQDPTAVLAKEETSGGPKTETKFRWTKDTATAASQGINQGAHAALEEGPSGGTDASRAGVAGGVRPGGVTAAKPGSIPYVGVIAGVSGCPAGSELITIKMDNEDYHNSDTSGGWIGGIVHDANTTFRFCRVDGSQFTTAGSVTYAVLQLAESCPAGSYSFWRLFDNENFQNTNSHSFDPPYLNLGGLSPNHSDKLNTSTRLYFCAYMPGNSVPQFGSTPFPDFGIEYGVFAPSNLPGALDTGHINIDDEDNFNKNSFAPGYYTYQSELGKFISGDLNTSIQLAKVRSGPQYGQLHSVSLNVSMVKGGGNGTDPVLTVALDGPAQPGGQRVYLSTNKPSIAWIMGPGYFTIPAGQTSESLSYFLGTSKVYGSNQNVVITATVNSVKGYANLTLEKTKVF